MKALHEVTVDIAGPRSLGHSALVRKILRAMNDELPISGERLARELGVSPGYLARAFKREMAMSLVDYRNQLRMDRFFEVIRNKGDRRNFLEAALEAGFGSYAQFHRVYRKLHGTSPRDILPEQGQPRPAPLDSV